MLTADREIHFTYTYNIQHSSHITYIIYCVHILDDITQNNNEIKENLHNHKFETME